MNLVTELNFPLLMDINSSESTYNIKLLSNTYSFHNKELEINLRDLLEIPLEPIKTDKLQTVSVIILKKFNSDMVDDLNNMTNLRQIIVPDEYSQVVTNYFPHLDIRGYYYSDEMYWWYIDYTMYGNYIYG
jgi:hypothetical protein